MDVKEYQPFGEEWKKEMKKWNKDLLIDLLRKTLIENQAYASQQMPSKDVALEMFKDFFIFHNEANKNDQSVIAYFDEWWNSKSLQQEGQKTE